MISNPFSQYITKKSINTVNSFVIIPETSCLTGISISGFWYLTIPFLEPKNNYIDVRTVTWVDQYKVTPLDKKGNKLEPIYNEVWDNHSVIPTGNELLVYFPGTNVMTFTQPIKKPTQYLVNFNIIRLYDKDTSQEIEFIDDLRDFKVSYTTLPPILGDTKDDIIKFMKRQKVRNDCYKKCEYYSEEECNYFSDCSTN